MQLPSNKLALNSREIRVKSHTSAPKLNWPIETYKTHELTNAMHNTLDTLICIIIINLIWSPFSGIKQQPQKHDWSKTTWWFQAYKFYSRATKKKCINPTFQILLWLQTPILKYLILILFYLYRHAKITLK